MKVKSNAKALKRARAIGVEAARLVALVRACLPRSGSEKFFALEEQSGMEWEEFEPLMCSSPVLVGAGPEWRDLAAAALACDDVILAEHCAALALLCEDLERLVDSAGDETGDVLAREAAIAAAVGASGAAEEGP